MQGLGPGLGRTVLFPVWSSPHVFCHFRSSAQAHPPGGMEVWHISIGLLIFRKGSHPVTCMKPSNLLKPLGDLYSSPGPGTAGAAVADPQHGPGPGVTA